MMSGVSGGYRRPLAPSSSSSTLSPLAPPFTVERPLPSVPSLSSPTRPPATHTPPSSQPFVAPHNWPSSASSAAAAAAPALSAASTSPYIVTGRGRPLPGPAVAEEPYRPSYPPGFLPPAADAPFEPVSAYKGYAGVGPGPWNGPFDGEEIGRAKGLDEFSDSSWMEPPSSFQVQPFQKGVGAGNLKTYEDDPYAVWPARYASSSAGKAHFSPENSTWLHNKRPGIYGEHATSSYSIPGASLYSSGVKGLSYSPPSDSMIEKSSTFIPDSSYDSFVGQRDSCLANSMAYYPATTCSTSGQVYMPPASSGSTMPYSLSKHSSCLPEDHVVPYLSDSRNMLAKPKEPSVDLLDGGKYDDGEKSRTNHGMKSLICTTVTSEITMPSGNKAIVDNPFDFCTEGNSGLIIKHLNLSNTCTSACGFGEPGASTQNSSEMLDHAVDSPCWKGASASQQSPFNVGEKGGFDPAEGLKGCSNPDPGQKYLPVTVANSEDPRGQVGSLISHDKKKTSIASQMNESPSVISSDIEKNSEDANKAVPDRLKDDSAKGIQCADSFTALLDEKEDLKSGSEAKHNDAIQFSLKEHFVAIDQFMAPNGIPNSVKGLDAPKEDGSSDFNPGGNVEPLPSLSGPCLSPSKKIQLLVKTLLKSSEELLSTECSYDNELEEQDHKCLQLVIDNLGDFARRIKKDARSQNTGLEADVVNQRNVTNASDMMRKMCSFGHSADRDEFDNSVFEGNTDYAKFDGLSQAFENVLEKTFSGQEENPQTLLYKNLWIQAEVEMCKLKYECQVSRMKLQMLNHRHRSKGNLHKWPDHQTHAPRMFLMRMTDHQRLEERSGAECSFSKSHDARSSVSSSLHEADNVATSVMACSRLVNEQSNKLSSRCMEGHELLDSVDSGILLAAKTAACTPCSDSENNTVLELLPTKLADLGFKDCGLQPYSDNEPRCRSSASRSNSRSDVRNGANRNEETGLCLDTSGSVAAREFRMSASDGSAIQSNITSRLGKWSLGDWEHVREEDFKL